MNWFLHNAVADLYGPYFLLFYAATIVVLIVAARRSIWSADRSLERGPPEIPTKLDPYEVAYLRGGENEVTRVAVASMIQRGLLRIVEDERWHSTIRTIGRGRKPEPNELLPVEAAVWDWGLYPADAGELFGKRGVTTRVKEVCKRYELDLAEEGLLVSEEQLKPLVRWLWFSGLAILLLLGVYKLIVAHAKGHANVAFLNILMVGGAVVYSIACLVTHRLSRRGKAYLARLKQVFGGPGGRLDASGDWAFAPAPDFFGRADPGAMARAAASGPDCLLLLGVFGVPALANTPLSVLNTMFTRSANGGGGCGGGGCGGGCGGGGCGGCGG